MGRSGGKRSNTRNSFSRAFKKHGQEHSSTYIKNFEIGELALRECQGPVKNARF